MRLLSSKPISFINAHLLGPAGTFGGSLRIIAEKIVNLNCPPEPGDAVIDLKDAVVLPGLINAHDHLELNNFPRLKWQDAYANAGEWIDDFQPRFATDRVLKSAMSVPLKDRLFIGGIKNLLSGVTTACHHGPSYRSLQCRFPIRVVSRYRHSHSLKIDGPSVSQEFLATPSSWPWIIHAGEGTDEAASREFSQLQQMGCLGPNTVIVHGVGFGREDQAALIRSGGSLIWCPSSNHFLFGTTADIALFCRTSQIALGTDSRLTGEKDLLDEIRFAAANTCASAESLLRMVTSNAASLLRLPETGELKPGAPADLVVIPRSEGAAINSILTDRSRVRLVVLGGQPQIGDVDLVAVFEETKISCSRIRLDGRDKLMSRKLIKRMKRCSVTEPGLDL